ncbi:MAG: LysM peptidoglycan-binding domain-containing protein [Chloroflexi bacterium]|nr:LysM peptidoglycan-binding domain-containing protein [Chloroflexota bacterium]
MPTRVPGSAILTPTPDDPHPLPGLRNGAEQHVVQSGDTLGIIALHYGVSVDDILAANSLTDPNVLDVGQVLFIPAPTPQAAAPGFKIIPDSELVHGPMSITLDIDSYIATRSGYLSTYWQDVDGVVLSGAQVIQRVAQNYSVNPRLLLAILEHRSEWVNNANPDLAGLEYPLGYNDSWHAGLYRQLTWAANTLNRGYYLWQVGGLNQFVLSDGGVVTANPTVNAGTAAVQYFFAQLDDITAWQMDVGGTGFFQSYSSLWGYPFDLAIEPLVPPDLVQPPLALPFEPGKSWAFTGGPHGGWDTGSGWAALDFSPVGTQGCIESDYWVTAVADGLILRSADGAVIQDLNNDGYEQTGWVIFYLHIESRDRVQAGVNLRAGERIGHPSCEGGISNGTHLHLARKFNGQWIPADGPTPFILDGWVSFGDGIEYDGTLRRGDDVVEAFDGASSVNQIQR